MLSMNDLQVGKLLVDHGIVSIDHMRQAFHAFHQTTSGTGKFLVGLKNHGLIDADQQQRAQGYIERESFMRHEAAYLEILKNKNAVNPQWIDKARAHQKEENFTRRFGELLVQAKQLSDEQHQFLLKLATESLEHNDRQTIEKELAGNFQNLFNSNKKGHDTAVNEGRLTGVLSRVEMTEILSAADKAEDGKLELLQTIRMPPPPPNPNLPPMPKPFSSPVPSNNSPPPPKPFNSPAPPPPPPPALNSLPPPMNPSSLPPPMATDGPQSIMDKADALAPPPPAPIPTNLYTSVEAPGQRVGDYELIRKLGEGGNGIVYLTRGPDGSECALKVTHPGADKDILARFKREILATALFDHDNVIQIFDAGEYQKAYFMAMEVLEGEEVRDLLKREGKLEIGRALELTRQILGGIGAAHRANIIHRDLKPENFMLLDRDGKDFVKIMDFGIARILDQEEEFSDQIFTTMAGKISGSPKYIAPESITEPSVDGRADIYTLGIIVFEMVTGTLPYHAARAMEYLQEHLYKAPKTIADVAPDLLYPESLQRFISRMLEKSPKKRFQTCEEALAFLTGMVIPDYKAVVKDPSKAFGKGKAKGKGRKSGKKTKGKTPVKKEGEAVAKTENKGCLGFLFKKKSG
ncbi:MAG: serine/threonine-protein kinase [Planctomycetota bacterium]|nr:serine/threonine-protein kinase [Planctomycetota bacterium]